jgi:excisionase family DNA binding protein
MAAEDKYMTVDEVAQYLGFEKQTIYNKIHNKEIPFHKIGLKAVRFKRAEIDAWVEEQRKKDEKGHYLKKGERYYLVSETSIGCGQIAKEGSLLEAVRRATKEYWWEERLPFEFDAEVLEAVKEILNAELVYPRLMKRNTPVYEGLEIDAITNYLTLQEVFKGKLNLDISYLRQLKKRLIENVNEYYHIFDFDTEENSKEAHVGFIREFWANELLSEFTRIIVYLEYGKLEYRQKENKNAPITYRDSHYEELVVYANRYFDSETCFTLYVHGFCYFVYAAFSECIFRSFLKDKTISELTPEQIEWGLKEKIINTEEVSKRIKQLEVEAKSLKTLFKQNAKGGKKHGSED